MIVYCLIFEIKVNEILLSKQSILAAFMIVCAAILCVHLFVAHQSHSHYAHLERELVSVEIGLVFWDRLLMVLMIID